MQLLLELLSMSISAEGTKTHSSAKTIQEVVAAAAGMSIDSIELWAAAKIIGRECATVNKTFFVCKKDKGERYTFQPI